MYNIYFESVTFAQSSKYLMIVKSKQQTKRSQVCSLWTSVPHFTQPIIIEDIQQLTIKACTATIDRKLTVIGVFVITQKDVDDWTNSNNGNSDENVVYYQQRNIMQVVEEKEVCVGNCIVKISRNQQKQHHFSKEQQEIDDQYQLKSQEDQQQQLQQYQRCELKFMIHCGFNFYLNAGFKVTIGWGKSYEQTKLVNNRINPYWGSTINLAGNPTKIVEISIIDNKGSKLQWIKIDPKQIRIMFPYHLKIGFRQQYVGMHPCFFMTILRVDVPLFSILDKKINMKMKYVGPAGPQRTQQYLLIYQRDVQTSQSNRLPQFLQLDMRSYISFDNINKIIQQNPDKKYEWTNWNLLIPISLPASSTVDPPVDCITILKSFITKPLACLYFSLQDPKLLFCQQLWNSTTVIDKKQSFENSIKQIYYQQKKIVMGKAVQISNFDVQGIENYSTVFNLQDKWKILTHNYQLRKKLLTTSVKNTQQVKVKIKQKGQYLQHLKKTLIEVKKMNEIMVQKQKSAFMQDKKVNRKIRQNYLKFSTIQIVTSLIQKQVELQKRKKINDEMRMRMDSLHYFNQDSQQLDKIVVQNAQKLLQQQAKLKQLIKIRQALPKQRQVILKLQKMFQRRQIDKQMNQMLIKQQNRLQQMKKAASSNLQKVYNIVKQHKNAPQSLLQNIKAAQTQLINLNSQYAKLTTY